MLNMPQNDSCMRGQALLQESVYSYIHLVADIINNNKRRKGSSSQCSVATVALLDAIGAQNAHAQTTANNEKRATCRVAYMKQQEKRPSVTLSMMINIVPIWFDQSSLSTILPTLLGSYLHAKVPFTCKRHARRSSEVS